MKIIDKIQQFAAAGKPTYSFEFFPPKTETGLRNLYERLKRMAELEPTFIDVTWGAGGSTTDLSLELSINAQKYFGLDVMMHLTCTNMPKEKILDSLRRAKDGGIMNILALRGDPPHGESNWQPCSNGFKYGSDLVKFIRDEFGDYFSIGVGAYPEGHLESESTSDDIRHLKTKVDAGADFIITQLFYDLDRYRSFVERSEEAGIRCPIIPGLLPIQTYDRFKRFTEFCKTYIPPELQESLEPIKSDDAAVQEYGIKLAADMCRGLREMGAPGYHFYTLNLETSVNRILAALGLNREQRRRRQLPWRAPTTPDRRGEDVRPIFWSNRPQSYLARTRTWDDFPNGRWGDSRSPTYGSLSEYYLVRKGLRQSSGDQVKELWGEPQTFEQVRDIFVKFCKNEISRLPWCEIPLQKETKQITAELLALNEAGFLTINSQPQVNGAHSDDPQVGWGGAGGYVYQKAYVEFFVRKSQTEKLRDSFRHHPSLTYQMVNKDGHYLTNTQEKHVNAVTWGVFPGKEIIQPTIVESKSFMIWKDEAFALWRTDWSQLYPESSPSRKFLEELTEDLYLVNVVENDFIEGNIYEAFEPLLESKDLQVRRVDPEVYEKPEHNI